MADKRGEMAEAWVNRAATPEQLKPGYRLEYEAFIAGFDAGSEQMRGRAEYGQTERTPSEKVAAKILIEEGTYQYDSRSERVIKRIAAAIDKAVAEEREACAKVAEAEPLLDRDHQPFNAEFRSGESVRDSIADAIRARKEKL